MSITKIILLTSSQSGSSIVISDQKLCFCLWLKTAGQKTVEVVPGYFWSIPVYLLWLKIAEQDIVQVVLVWIFLSYTYVFAMTKDYRKKDGPWVVQVGTRTRYSPGGSS